MILGFKNRHMDVVTEWEVFNILDTLPKTSTGLDNLPAWFLRLGAPAFCNKSIATSVVPLQWKRAYIRPVPKNTTPVEHSDFRPISITPVLCRTLERVVVKRFLYPALLTPPAVLSDQYAFRPTGSTTTALIALLQSSLLRKMALLDIPDPVYN